MQTQDEYPLTGTRWGVIRKPNGDAWLLDRQTGEYVKEGGRDAIWKEALKRAKEDAGDTK